MNLKKLLKNKTQGWLPKEPKMPEIGPKFSGKKIAIFVSLTILIASASIFSIPYFFNHPTVPYNPIEPQVPIPTNTPYVSPSPSSTISIPPQSPIQEPATTTSTTGEATPTPKVNYNPTATSSGTQTPQPTVTFAPKPQTAELDPQFNVNTVYAYVGSRTIQQHSATEHFPTFPQTTGATVTETDFTLVLNASMSSNLQKAPYDTICEVYRIQISSEQGLTKNVTYYLGAAINPSFDVNSQLGSIGRLLASFGGTGAINGIFITNLTEYAPFSFLKQVPIATLGDFGTAQSLVLSVYRYGWITCNGASSTAYLSSKNEVLSRVQLQKFGTGFIYNNLLPPDQLSSIDLFSPPIS
jgi:hypothetical protein